jgi:hypothetical protein
MAQFRTNLPEPHYDEVVDRLVKRTLSPWEAVKELLKGY